MFQQVSCRAEGLIQLAIEIITVRHHDDGRIVHLRLLQQLTRITDHGNTLTRTLGVPNHTRLARTRHYLVAIGRTLLSHLPWPRRDHRHPHCLAHRMELVISGDLLDDGVAIVFKQNKVADVVQQQLAIKEAPDDFLQLILQ